MTDTANRSPSWPLALFAGTLAFLAWPIVAGGTGARLGAAGAVVGMVAAFLFGLRTTRREHADDQASPSLLALARESTAQAGRMFVYIAVYVVLVFVVALARGGASRGESRITGVVVATVAAVCIIGTMVDGARIARRREGVEKQVYIEASSYAFFATVLAAVSYGLFEAFAGAPAISMWAVWTFGMVAWGIATAVLSKRKA